MNINNIKSKLDSRCLHSKKTLSFVSLLFMIAIIYSPFVSVYSGVSPFVLGADPDVEGVNTESDLVKAINDAPDGTSYVIQIRNINLEETLEIPDGKNITLVNFSTGSGGLYGADDKATISVMSGGELVLDGIIVSHVEDAKGIGVDVAEGGKLTIVAGRIFDNVASNGAGVYNKGNFTMAGGVIRYNNASNSGGGVYNMGNFNVTGGEIHNNRASTGGGIYSDSDKFRMTGGEIHNNVATRNGGGVYTTVDFVMSGGRIYRNTANDDGGGVYNYDTFIMSGGMIYNNTAAYGGGVYTRDELFKMSGGSIISNNTVTGNGGGIYIYSGALDIIGDSNDNRCLIANNTAGNGGGIGIYGYANYEYININRYTTFSNNRASSAYNRSTDDNRLYSDHIDDRVTWTSPFTQGYNNYDIQYTRGTQIDDPTASPSPSPSATPTPTPTPTSPTNTVRPTTTPPPEDDSGLWWKILIVVAIVIALVIALLVFYLPKRQAKQAEPDWIDSTPTTV